MQIILIKFQYYFKSFSHYTFHNYINTEFHFNVSNITIYLYPFIYQSIYYNIIFISHKKLQY
jgi:hypothetical protein